MRPEELPLLYEYEAECVTCSMLSDQVHLGQPALKFHRITGNIFHAYFNDPLSACLNVCYSVCVCVCSHGHRPDLNILDV